MSASEPWDPLHRPGDSDLHWSTDNVGEAAPGVLTPLSATLWGWVGDLMPRHIAYAMGAYTRAESKPPAADGRRIVQLFYGRIAMKMEYMAEVGDRVPGTTGEDTVRGLFGRVPAEMTFRSTRRRYPVIAVKMPVAFVRAPARVRKLAGETDAWWRAQIPRLPDLDRAAAVASFEEGVRRFNHTINIHALGLLSSVQPLYDAVARLVERTGVGEVGALSGSGGAELAIVEDIWAVSRGRMELDELVRNHGFHGPLEGELSSRVWRDDPTPLEKVVREYAARDDSADPKVREAASQARAEELRREVIAAVPRVQRPATRALLNLAAARLPMRGVGKRSFLQAMDVARASARRVGECLVEEGLLDDPEDVFYLTMDELTGTLPADTKDLVARRRERRAEYQQLSIPGNWKGTPEPVRIDAAGEDDGDDPDAPVTGIGVSDGVVEGTVRVVTDPAFAEVEPDEILVSATTDPSWASIMFVSSALVVDMGGALSHAAVVARELAVPCVVNTRTGTRRLRTGDRVRVDGSAGTVEILERAEVPKPESLREAL